MRLVTRHEVNFAV